MSFAPEFAPDALAQWASLEFEIQEIVLDVLENLAQQPPMTDEHFVDVDHDVGNVRHSIFKRVFVDRLRARVVAVGVGHVTDAETGD
jgi:hypothetical protein